MNKKEEGKGEEMRKVDLQKEERTIASKSVAKTSWHLLVFQKKKSPRVLLSTFYHNIWNLMLVERWSDMMEHNTRRWLHKRKWIDIMI